MKLKALKLKGFRAYREPTTIPVGDLTALVGRNDVGKSTLLDALAIFFESPLVKFDATDICIRSDDRVAEIGCVFGDLPSEVVLDSDAPTSLADEYLLNADGDLEVVRVFDCSKSKLITGIVAIAVHPTTKGLDDLLLKKNTDLKKLLKAAGSDASGVDQRNNVAMRSALWGASAELAPRLSRLDLNKDNAKTIWQQLKGYLPTFALFRADRPSTDEDSEVQDPMKLAIRQALAEVSSDLDTIKRRVQERALGVAIRTVERLQATDASLAETLQPDFRAEPKWDSIFKLALQDGDGIAINKRGGGVRRLVLLSFFQAEAERLRNEHSRSSTIVAIEEPETSLHPELQRRVVESLGELSEQEGYQVLLTTHVPGLAGLLPPESIRHVGRGGHGHPTVELLSDDVARKVADDLGVLPDGRSEVLLCVEGRLPPPVQ
jgi:putative ATP-dependent endonuclease of OLD family